MKVKSKKDLASCTEYGISIIEKDAILEVLNVNDETYGIDMNGKEYAWRKELFEIIEEGNTYMKELTFREVIANSKIGEIWKGKYKTIERVNEGFLINTNDEKSYNGYGIFDNELFKLQRKEYTFTEAFKAYEEGKSIESCATGNVYYKQLWINMGESDDKATIERKEIRSKWYIED